MPSATMADAKKHGKDAKDKSRKRRLERGGGDEETQLQQQPPQQPSSKKRAREDKKTGAPKAAAVAPPAQEEEDDEDIIVAPPTASVGKTDPGWTNRQRTLVFSSRGVSYRARHLMNDLRSIMPHSKKDAKMDRKDKLHDTVPEICEMKNCNNCIYFEARKKQDLYMWLGKMPHGPTAKFLVENVHTMDEMRLTGNCLKGSRPIINFDSAFDTLPHLKLLKEMFFQAFATPCRHPKSKPFVDRVLSFFIVEGRVWVRNYQISWKDAKVKDSETTLAEIGPRFVLNPIRIFRGSFGGPTLYENPDYLSPNQHRASVRASASLKYKDRQQAYSALAERRETQLVLHKDEVEDVFMDASNAQAAARAAKA